MTVNNPGNEPSRAQRCSRHWLVLLILLLAGSLSLRAQFGEFGTSLQYFPQFAVGGGATTFFTIHNPTTGAISVQLQLYRSDGSLLSSQDVQLSPGATQTVKLGGSTGTATPGWAKLSSAGRFSASEFFQFTDAAGQLLSEVGVLPSVASQKFKLFAFVKQQSASGTGIAIANPSASSASTLTVRLFNLAGQLVNTRTITLGPLQHLARFLYEDPYFVGLDNFEGTVDVSATQPVTAVTLRLDGRELAAVAVITPGLPLRAEFTSGSPNFIGGDAANSVASGLVGVTIGGGGSSANPNRIVGGDYATISGGEGNTAGNGSLKVGLAAAIGGGNFNVANADFATVAGGDFNNASDDYSTVGGGTSNEANGLSSTVAGGDTNIANGDSSTVPGGKSNTAQGNFSLAAGRRAKANHDGAFVWGDSTDLDIASTGANQFVARAAGGVTFYSNAAASLGVRLAPGSGSWSAASDRAAKANFIPADGRAVLESLSRVPISTWNYIAQDSKVRHIGPTAQDFYAAFGVGEDERHISAVDADGVGLAAIQTLYSMARDKNSQIAALEARLTTQQKENADTRARLAALEALLAKH